MEKMSLTSLVNGLQCACEILYNKTHVLHSYLPERVETVYSLCTRPHNKSLTCKNSDLNNHKLLVRATYKNCY